MPSPRLTLRQLQIFIAIADCGSTTTAAVRIALSQSAISGALNELEILLDAPLFDRIGKRLMLNDTGRSLLPEARGVLQATQEIETRFGVGEAAMVGRHTPAQLRLGASTTIGNYLVPDLVAGYLRSWSRVGIDVQIGNTRDIAAAVGKLSVDLGLIEGPCHEPNLQVLHWKEDELIIVCARTHPLALHQRGAIHTPQELQAAQWLLREVGSGTREAVEQALLPYLQYFHVAMQLGSPEAVKRAAAAGLGLACMSRCAVEDLLALGDLVEVNTTLPRLTRQFYLVHHRRKPLSPSMVRFISHCGNY